MNGAKEKKEKKQIWSLMQKKCHVMKFGKSGMRPDWEYKSGNDRSQESDKEKKSGSSYK